ncbi:MAG: hypothetical protein ACLVBJ_11400 [Pilosibacter sp.]
MAGLQESNVRHDRFGEPISIIWPEEGAPASVRGSDQREDGSASYENSSNSFYSRRQRQLVDAGDEGYFEPSLQV